MLYIAFISPSTKPPKLMKRAESRFYDGHFVGYRCEIPGYTEDFYTKNLGHGYLPMIHFITQDP
jgi:hypothetical protein